MALKDLLRTYKDDRILVPAIDRYLLTLNEEGFGDGWIHPSGIARCVRSQFYSLLRAPKVEDVNAKLRRIFENGDYTHLRLQRLMLRAKLTIPSLDNNKGEHKFESKKYRVRGTCDGIIKSNDAILEIKSINQRGFSALSGPKAEHIWQTHLYMWGLQKKLVVYLYECKDTQDLREFVRPFDQETFDTIFERIEYLNKCYDNGKLPDKWSCVDGASCDCDIEEMGQKWVDNWMKSGKHLRKP